MQAQEGASAVHPVGESGLEQLRRFVDAPGGSYFAEVDDQTPVLSIMFFVQHSSAELAASVQSSIS